MQPFARETELPCRLTWDADLWEQMAQVPVEVEPQVVGLVIWEPVMAGTPIDAFPEDLLRFIASLAATDEGDAQEDDLIALYRWFTLN